MFEPALRWFQSRVGCGKATCVTCALQQQRPRRGVCVDPRDRARALALHIAASLRAPLAHGAEVRESAPLDVRAEGEPLADRLADIGAGALVCAERACCWSRPSASATRRRSPPGRAGPRWPAASQPRLRSRARSPASAERRPASPALRAWSSRWAQGLGLAGDEQERAERERGGAVRACMRLVRRRQRAEEP